MKHFLIKVLSVVLVVLLVCSVFAGCKHANIPTTTTPTESTTKSDNLSDEADVQVEYDPNEPVTVPDEVKEIVADTKEDIKDREDLSTGVTEKSTPEEEKEVSDEGALEKDASVQQGHVSYDGTNTGKGKNLLGAWQGLTYYAQTDSRWSSILYTSTGNRSQTIGSSGCGPTSAAMVVSSSKGAILPTAMCSLYRANGFRTPNDGTAWSAMSFTADYFDFNYFAISYSYAEAFKYLRIDKNKDGISDYFVICACGPGLWTSGGHYIAIMNDDDGELRVHDPYPYGGKYNSASRRGANVRMSGNIAYVTEAKFKQYSNVNCFFIFSNDHTGSSKQPSTKVNYTRYVATESLPLNVRSGPGTGYGLVGSLKRGTKVTVTEVSGGWSKIGSGKWVNSGYLSSTPVNSGGGSSSSTSYSTKVNGTYKLKAATALYSKSNLTGTRYDYKANTTVKVISHASTSVDYVLIPATGRKAYCKVSAFTSTSSSSSTAKKSTVGQIKYLKAYTTLYSKSNLTGTQYQYHAGTQVKILKNVSSSVDYIYVTKTGRYAYTKSNVYK